MKKEITSLASSLGITVQQFENNESFNWVVVSCKKLSEKFIWKYRKHLKIYWVVIQNKLSEKFIEKLDKAKELNKLEWNAVFLNQSLSEEFKNKHRFKITPAHLAFDKKFEDWDSYVAAWALYNESIGSPARKSALKKAEDNLDEAVMDLFQNIETYSHIDIIKHKSPDKVRRALRVLIETDFKHENI